MYSSRGGGGGDSWKWEILDQLLEEDMRQSLYWEASCSSILMRQGLEHWPDVNTSTLQMDVFASAAHKDGAKESASIVSYGQRKRRRRRKSVKNKAEVEKQRMTHIVVERKRRKQMNDYIAVLRSLMPSSYVQKTDQASIIGGAINFVKELEHRLQFLQVHKELKQQQEKTEIQNISNTNIPLSNLFNFPQFSLTTISSEHTTAKPSALAQVEVTMVESHANLKLLTKQRRKQLFKLVLGLQNLHLTTTHLNVTTVKPMVLYSFGLTVEEDSELASADDIASSVHQILEKINEETGF